MKKLYFDIETGPLPEAELIGMMPEFDAPSNLKDPDKIAAAIAKKRADYIADAALDPLTGCVLAIGVNGDVVEGDEAEMLKAFWWLLSEDGRFPQIIGFNITGFDLPFLFKRSWRHGIKPPSWLRKGRYWDSDVVDLREVWCMGDRTAKGSLEAVAMHLGLGCKLGSGKDFAALWKDDKQAAIKYLKRDVELTKLIAERMGL